MKLPQQGQRIVWLVRVLTVIGLTIVVTTTGLVGWTLAKVRRERVRVTAVQERLDLASEALRGQAAEGRSEIQNIFDEAVPQRMNQQSAAAKFDELIHSQFKSQPDRAVMPALVEFRTQVSLLTDLEARANGWRANYAEVWKDLRQQQSMGQVRQIITQLRTAVETLEGRRRLEEAIRYRRWRVAVGAEANQQAESILTEHARQQSEGANDCKSDLAECARLVELLGGEEQLDNLADLKDNRLMPVLDRLSRTVATYRPEQTGPDALPPQTIEKLKTALFGRVSDGQGAPVGSGGLFKLRYDALHLRRERELLKKELAGLFQTIEAANADFAQSARILTAGLTQQMERSLGSGWRQLLIFGSGSSALFFWLAWMISRGIKGQVDTIEHARAEAETGRQTTHDLMLKQQEAATQLVSAHQGLQASEQRFRTLSASAPIGIFLTDAAGLALYTNPHWQSITGLSLEKSLGEGWAQAVHPEDSARVFAEWHLAASEGREFSGQFRFCTMAGEVRWVHVQSAAIRSETGEVTGHVGTVENITERKRAEEELAKTQKELLETSRMAGMAEVATGVLHNVGNVLNSVNVSSTCVADGIRKSKAANLSKVVALLREHAADLSAFLTSDPKGRQLPAYLGQLAEHLAAEQASALKELAGLQKNIEHIKDIVAMQQSFAKVSGVTETVKASDLVEDALKMNSSSLARHDIEIVKDFGPSPPFTVEKHKVLQILVNLIRNAKHACDATGRSDKRVTLRVTNGDEGVRIAVTDNGTGIPAENLTRIFAHGFTTKTDGHGFGLHSGALAAKEMGGSLRAYSDGPGCGSKFILELPFTRDAEPAKEQAA